MPRSAAKFRQADIKRALKAVQKVGDFSVRVEPDGSLLFVRDSDKKPERKTDNKVRSVM